MTTHESILSQLDDYLDGLLEPNEKQEVDAHLASCPACAHELQSLRNLLSEARQLPEEIEPSRDLWPQLAERLEAASYRERPKVISLESARPSGSTLFSLRSVSWLLAAVLAFALLLPPTLHGLRPASTPARTTGKDMLTLCSDSMVDDYRAVLARDEGKLSADTEFVLNRSLNQIQAALRETVVAMNATDVNSPEYRSLAASYRNKLNLLQRIAVQMNTL
jgi:hypothetical protein